MKNTDRLLSLNYHDNWFGQNWFGGGQIEQSIARWEKICFSNQK